MDTQQYTDQTYRSDTGRRRPSPYPRPDHHHHHHHHHTERLGLRFDNTPGKRPEVEATLVANLNGVLYDILVRTNTNQIYDEDGEMTLTDILYDIGEALTDQGRDIERDHAKIKAILKDAPKSYNTFREIWDYINIHGNPRSELIRLIQSKQQREKGKGLSTNDFTDILCEKLTNDYTKEELDEKFGEVAEQMAEEFAELESRVQALEDANNMYMSHTDEPPEQAKEGDVWFQVVDEDTNHQNSHGGTTDETGGTDPGSLEFEIVDDEIGS